MQALAQPHGAYSNSRTHHKRYVETKDGLVRGSHQHVQQTKPLCQQLQTPAASGVPKTRASATFAETWTGSVRRTARQQELVRPRKLQPVTGQQPSSSSTSTPSLPTVQPHVLQPHAVQQQPVVYATTANPQPQPLQQSSSGQTSSQTTQQTLATAVDKMYRQRLREVKAMLTPDSMQQLQQELSAEELHSLQVVLQDLQDLQGSWEEEDEQLNPAEQQLIQQVTSAAQIMPDDFNSYLMGMLPPGSGHEELQQLLQMLDEPLLRNLKSVYYELKEFEQADLEVSAAQDRYIQLSGRISAVAARIQQTLEIQQQQLQERRQPVQQQMPQPPCVPSSSNLYQQQTVRSEQVAAAPAQSAQSSAAAGSSSSSSSRKWGSAWARSQNPRSSTFSAQGSSSDSSGLQQAPHTVQLVQPQGQQQEGLQSSNMQPQQFSTPQQPQQQQQQQPGVRQRRRRVIRRDATNAD